MSTATQMLRPITKVVEGMRLSEGAGVQIRRTVGTPKLRNLDPFLMLDELKLPLHQASAGFPDHPHRGFETCSIMLEGEMQHKDSAGNAGVIGPGGVQWMTAGRGLVHSEMPVGRQGRLWGFQLWINLPAKHKMTKPRYQDYQASDIPAVEAGGSRVRVMAGRHAGTTGPIVMKNPGMLFDVILQPGAAVTLQVPRGWAGFAYVYDGAGSISGSTARVHHALVLGDGDHITAQGAAAAGAGGAAAAPGPGHGDGSDSNGYGQGEGSGLKFLLVAGQPIGEPIVQHGPFVMNSQAEIAQAFTDYQAGRLQDPRDNVWAGDDEL
ncbi:RmlC-like cupin domain-containing protein [Scenedesmus sp. NREL 46B-D3]|nr:RmlC-like cupin domain-containing protein [Scenedesmus sp. NREL 46B-D3]